MGVNKYDLIKVFSIDEVISRYSNFWVLFQLTYSISFIKVLATGTDDLDRIMLNDMLFKDYSGDGYLIFINKNFRDLTCSTRTHVHTSLYTKLIFAEGQDWLYEVLGQALYNDMYEQELDNIVETIHGCGGDVIINERGKIAYDPSYDAGVAGRVLIDKKASIGAWRHEYQHFLDDKALGFPGLVFCMSDAELHWKFEEAAYEKEIESAMEINRLDIAEKIKVRMEEVKNELLSKRSQRD